MVGHQGAGPDQPGLGQRIDGDNDPWTELEASGRGVGLALNGATQLKPRVADLDAVAEPQTEPVEDCGIDRRTEIAAAAVDRGAKGLRRR